MRKIRLNVMKNGLLTMNDTWTLKLMEEPKLAFGYGQTMVYPKDGSMLFGPLADARSPYEIRVGVIGTKMGHQRYRRWVKKINGYIPAEKSYVVHHSAYPGFETIFGCKWQESPICEIEIAEKSIKENLYLDNRYEAIFNTVGLYESEIKRYLREEEAHVDVWFVVIPEEIYKLGRPKSILPIDLKVESSYPISQKMARVLQIQPSLFSQDNEAAQLYKFHINFHNQLKARLLDVKAVLQVVRETSLTPEDFEINGRPLRRVQDLATLAWNLTTTTFFKASGRPWKLANVRDGVCYVGIVFKQDMTPFPSGNACCGAQMFLDSGDGLVFKGAVGPWYSKETKEYHLSREKASDLMRLVVNAYIRENAVPPKELFIHGRTRFNVEEWNGFTGVVPSETNLVGVRIKDESMMKLYGPGKESVLRGIALKQSRKKGYLWTRGYIPRLQTYPGRGVPNALSIEICQGDADLGQVMQDIMGLTKVNFNSCIYADGYPVTLRFADRVGEILTAMPLSQDFPPLPFKHYI